MNVLFYRYNSICEPAFIKALTDAGVNVIEETTEMTKKSLNPSELVNNVSSILSKEKFLFVISINFFQPSPRCAIYSTFRI